MAAVTKVCVVSIRQGCWQHPRSAPSPRRSRCVAGAGAGAAARGGAAHAWRGRSPLNAAVMPRGCGCGRRSRVRCAAPREAASACVSPGGERGACARVPLCVRGGIPGPPAGRGGDERGGWRLRGSRRGPGSRRGAAAAHGSAEERGSPAAAAAPPPPRNARARGRPGPGKPTASERQRRRG